VVPGHFVHRLPEAIDLKSACLCEPLAVALKGLKRLEQIWQPRPSAKRCAVVGAGPLGNLLVRALTLKGHEVTVFDRNPKRLSYLGDLGVRLAEHLEGLDEFDVLVEVTGDPDALNSILTQSPAGATILLLGLPYAHRKFTFESIVAFDKTVVGSVGSSAEDFEEAISMLPRLNTRAFTQTVLPLSEFSLAWQHVRNRQQLKVLLGMGQELNEWKRNSGKGA
jgi:threonine dehydrogenase-like Zn-dependent dehydrogenase